MRWFEIQKAFGPVHFQKIGIRYAEQRLFILLDMSLTAGGLTIELTGLGLSSTLQHFDPEFTIEGIAVTFAEGPVSVSGGLEGTIHPVNLVGELVISAPEFTIAALGAYAEVDHHPSFFLYAVLDYPIGGPAAFFVTGLALGFGFNRKLVLPSVAGVATFPFVEWAMGTGNAPGMDTGGNIGQQVDQVLETLSTQGVVAPSIGEDWLAVGVRFTSYELLNSFALATVIFGTEFELALLGLSRLSIPVAVKPPVAQAELAIKAAFVPKSGLLSISAQLTPNSYILSPSSHLTGGFAFYLWFSGPHAGEFVVTLGGYSPRFTPPEYYPQVPRLGLNWALPGGNLTIKGDLYFALTSSAVMAGGELSAVWHSGDLRAWFTVQADFLMVFKPFHYYISASISIGASFRINLLFTKVTETIHVGVSLQLWGPQFTGVARVDLSIISFTIHFGDSQQQTTTTISWREFVKQLLPGTSTAHTMALPVPEPAVSSMVQITVTRGLIKALRDQPDAINAVVNGETFEIVTHAVIPSKRHVFSDNIALAPDAQQPQQDGQPIVPNTDFGIGPTGTDAEDFLSTHCVTIKPTNGVQFHAIRVLQNVPVALWQKRAFDSHGVSDIQNPLQDTTLDNVLTGYRILPLAAVPDATLAIPLETLQATIAEPVQHFTWGQPTYPIEDPFQHQAVAGTICSPTAQRNRNQLLAAMAQNHLSLTDAIDVSQLAQPSDHELLSEPVLSLLGEEKAVS